MKTKILVKVPRLHDVYNEALGLRQELLANSITTSIVCNKDIPTVETPNCVVIFVYSNQNLRGIKADASFYFSIEEQVYLNSSNEPTIYDGTFFDYILEKEKRND